jgi:hypothetical protein
MRSQTVAERSCSALAETRLTRVIASARRVDAMMPFVERRQFLRRFFVV